VLASGDFSTGTYEVTVPQLRSGVYTAVMVSNRGTKTLNIAK
jgi:hypothetical protein